MSAGFESKTSRPFRTCVHCARLRYELGRSGSLVCAGYLGGKKALTPSTARSRAPRHEALASIRSLPTDPMLDDQANWQCFFRRFQ